MLIVWFKKNLATIVGIAVISTLILLLFTQLITHLSENLFDWHDYPLFVWIMQQNITHWKQLDFSLIFESNIFYPFTNTLLFSDLFWPQSVIGLILSLFLKNPILIFNLVFLVTIVLNVIASYYFWQTITKNKWLLFFAALTTSISSFVLQNWYHFQIFSLWPFLFSLGYAFRSTELTVRQAVIAALLIWLTFYSSIYLWVLLLTALVVWYSLLIIKNNFSKAYLMKLGTFAIICLSVMVLTTGYTIFSYWQTRHIYQAKRDYHEYVNYSAQVSDYLFPSHLSSLIWRTQPVRFWNSFNGHYGLFPGITLIALAVFGLVIIKPVKRKLFVGMELTMLDAFMLCLLMIGFVFSLGPRFNFNDIYLRIPLPYHVFLKVIPLFEVVRVTSRWSLFFFLSLTYFAIRGLQKLPKKYLALTVIGLSVFYLAEVYPFSRPSEARDYYPVVYQKIEQPCQQTHAVLLEYPMTEFRDGANISTNLSYRTQQMLASVLHGCRLVNGYSGYIPKEYEQYEQLLFESVEHNNSEQFWKLIKQRQVRYIKLNKQRLFADRVQTLTGWLESSDRTQLLYNDANYILVLLMDE